MTSCTRGQALPCNSYEGSPAPTWNRPGTLWPQSQTRPLTESPASTWSLMRLPLPAPSPSSHRTTHGIPDPSPDTHRIPKPTRDPSRDPWFQPDPTGTTRDPSRDLRSQPSPSWDLRHSRPGASAAPHGTPRRIPDPTPAPHGTPQGIPDLAPAQPLTGLFRESPTWPQSGPSRDPSGDAPSQASP